MKTEAWQYEDAIELLPLQLFFCMFLLDTAMEAETQKGRCIITHRMRPTYSDRGTTGCQIEKVQDTEQVVDEQIELLLLFF